MKKKKTNKILRFTVIAAVALAAVVYLAIPRSDLGNYETATVKTGNIINYYSFSGNVSADNRDTYVAQMPVEIDKVHVKQGDTIDEDDTIISLKGGRKLKANIDGKLILLDVKKGDKIPAGKTLYDLADMDSLQVIIKVDENDLAAIKTGDKVDVHFNAIDGKTVPGTVTNIAGGAVVENNISYFTATISIPYDQDVRLGMSSEVKIIKTAKQNVLAIPVQTLQFDSENKAYVFCKNDKGKLEKRYVTLGINDGSIVEVTSGLTNGEIFYTPKEKTKMTSPMDMWGDRK